MATQPEPARELAELRQHCHDLITALDRGYFGQIDTDSAFIAPLRESVAIQQRRNSDARS